ncbi:MAG: GH92 family glycosyl hydrolase [bacterium]|nr:MAG: GH92 family glycosyl hydrolase [bacterium]
MKIGHIATLVVASLLLVAAAPGLKRSYTDLVDPFIGTGGHGHTYPGVTLPFGMVQLSPDTRLTGWDGCSAYHYSDRVVYGFSHTHLSGTGCSDYGDVLFMPTVGEVRITRGGPEDTGTGYCSHFSHRRETAAPGYYSVLLGDYGIGVELTATKRCGFHRYTFPASEAANIIIDLQHRDPVIASAVRIIGSDEIEGFRRSDAWANDQHIYFVAKFSKPFRYFGVALDDSLEMARRGASGRNVKAFLSFATGMDEQVLVKVGISAVDIEGARKNLEAEIPGWDFDGARTAANLAWNEALGCIRIDGGTKEQRTVFYTALYHTMLAPNLFMDVDGRYRGRDLEVHRADDFEYYTVFSLWDTYRAAHPLFTIIEPERTVDFIRTFIAQYEQGGILPVWELAANETWCMIGYHSVSVIADAFIKGIRDYDVTKAFEAMKHSAEQDHHGLEHYKRHGFIPAEKDGESVSRTLEYAYDDWCIAQMALVLGQKDDYGRYMERAQSYKNLFDPSTGFMRARIHGSWFAPFDPAEVNFNYTEANAWQYSFYVPQDITGLITLMGGEEHFSAKLNELFTTGSETSGWDQPDVSGLIGQYAHGNEPSHHMAYLYVFAGRPWKTQERVRHIMATMYTASPDGLCGNEDCGQMSAWFVLSALGFYPVTPGQEIYTIGSPLFERAVIDVGGGKRFVIEAKNVSEKDLYVQSVSLNGAAYGKSYIRHEDIVSGGELVFTMGPAPNRKWGNGKGERPHSAITDHLVLPVPYLASGERIFRGSTDVACASLVERARIHYTATGMEASSQSAGDSEPTIDSPRYTGPFTLTGSAVIKARAFKGGYPPSRVMEVVFTKIPEGMDITINSPYSTMYAAGGDYALIDGIHGNANFRTGVWQGYQGVDIDAEIDLGGPRTIHRISMGFLHDQGAWIFLPERVEYAVSTDGIYYEPVAGIDNEIPQERDGVHIEHFAAEDVNRTARYVRLRAVTIGLCPEWHRGAGGKAWLFTDEVVIE